MPACGSLPPGGLDTEFDPRNRAYDICFYNDRIGLDYFICEQNSLWPGPLHQTWLGSSAQLALDQLEYVCRGLEEQKEDQRPVASSAGTETPGRSGGKTIALPRLPALCYFPPALRLCSLRQVILCNTQRQTSKLHIPVTFDALMGVANIARANPSIQFSYWFAGLERQTPWDRLVLACHLYYAKSPTSMLLGVHPWRLKVGKFKRRGRKLRDYLDSWHGGNPAGLSVENLRIWFTGMGLATDGEIDLMAHDWAARAFGFLGGDDLVRVAGFTDAYVRSWWEHGI